MTISLKGIHHSYKNINVLKNVSLEVDDGEKVVIIGENGTGKTTLFNIISGLLKPSKGEVKIFGENVYPRNHRIYRKMGIITHTPFLFKNLTVEENISFFSRVYGCDAENIVKKLKLQKMLFFKVENLSAGQMKRVDFARCLLHSPELLILDEPFANLDRKWTVKISEMFNGRTVLMLSLKAPEYTKFIRIYRLRNGSIVRDESVGAEDV